MSANQARHSSLGERRRPDTLDLHANFPLRVVLRNRRYTNAGELLLAMGEPVRRALRSADVEELFLTGEGSDFERFSAVLEALPHLGGHPAVEAFSDLLRDLLDCEIPLAAENAERIWTYCAEALAKKVITPKTVLKKCRVSDLAFPETASADLGPYKRVDPCGKGVKITPIFAPVSLLMIKSGFRKEIMALAKRTGVTIRDYNGFCEALRRALDLFGEVGCRMAYHEMPVTVQFVPPNEYRAANIFELALARDGRGLSAEEKDLFFAQMMRVLGQEYKKRGMALQLYLGSTQDTAHERGVPTGGVNAHAALQLLQYLKSCNGLVNTILFVQNLAEFDTVAPLMTCFAPEDGVNIWLAGTLEMPFASQAGRHIEAASCVASLSRYLGSCSGACSPLAYLGAERMLGATFAFVRDRLAKFSIDPAIFMITAQGVCYRRAKTFLE